MIAFPAVEKPVPVPKRSAAIGDKLQYYAAHYPNALARMVGAIDYALDHDRELEAAQMIAARRLTQPSPLASPMPAMSFETNERLEYTDIRVNDPRVLMAPAENRLGRYMGDVLQSDAMERYLKMLHKVKTGGRGRQHRGRYNGVMWRAAIIMPSSDRIVTTVTNVDSGTQGQP